MIGLFNLIGGWLGGPSIYIPAVITPGPGLHPAGRTYTVPANGRSFIVRVPSA